MNTSHDFRRSLALRLFALLAVSVPAAGATGCVVMSSSCPESSDPIVTEECFTWPPPDQNTGGGGGSGGAGGAGGAGGGGEPVACPATAEAQQHINETQFGGNYTVKSGPTEKNGQCCYQAEHVPICEGRPYLVDEVARTAPFARGGNDGAWSATKALAPRVDDLEPELRALLAAAWTRDALFEHASVASFGRFALELLAAGAPAELVEEAHRAALDEARHARLCFSLASAYAGETIAPGAFPFEGRVEVVSDLASIAARAVKEGCIGETIAAVVAAEELAAAEDPAVRSVLALIAEEEARHAELAWRTVAWAVRAGGAGVRAAVEEVFAGIGRGDVQAFDSGHDARLAAHGRLGDAARSEAAARAIEEVVRPAARALLASRGDGAARAALAS